MTTEDTFPQPPTFTEEQLDACRTADDYRPVLFEWYKYTAIVANIVASIDLSSPAIRPIQKPHFATLIGLLNRCSRLMLANVALSHDGLYGETTALIDRSIFESCVKILWLCQQDSNDAFARYIADGLKTELTLKAQIQAKISARANKIIPIEERMLKSIARYLKTAEMSDAEIAAAKKLPDLATMIESLGKDRLAYVVGQKISSHHVHGTWPSLLLHYLEWDEQGSFHLRDHNCETHVNQYVSIPLMVLSAAKSFCAWLMKAGDSQPFVDLLQSIEDEILSINQEVIGSDFTVAEET